MWRTLFVRQPRLVALTVGLALVAGLTALSSLPRLEDPLLTARFATITTIYPGASAARVEALVTEKIEDELSEIEEIKELASTSRTAVSTIEIDLDDTVTAVDEVWSRVRDRLSDVEAELPADAETPEFTRQTTIAHTFLVGFVWQRDDRPPLPGLLARLATELEHRLAVLPGTKETELFGAPDEEFLVTFEPHTLASVNLTAAEVSHAIAQSDSKIPAGELHSERNELIIEVRGALESVAQIRRIPLRQLDNGRFLRVGDIAEVTRTIRSPPRAVTLVGGRRAVVVGAKMEADRRIDLWAAAAHAAVADFATTAPVGVGIEVVFDQSDYTNRRLEGLAGNLMLGVGLVVAILLLTMGWRSALLVGTALPLSIALVLPVLRILDIPLHQMSVTGLIIALGLLIDNAIVAVDEYNRGRAEGKSPTGSIDALVAKLAVPLFASSVTTILTFMPIVVMPGPVGEFVGAMGLAVMLAVASSLFLAMTVIPAFAAYLDRRGAGPVRRRGGVVGLLVSGWSPGPIGRLYDRTLAGMLAWPAAGILVAIAPAVAGFVVSGQLIGQFFPPVDRAQFQIQLNLAPQASIAETEAAVRRARAILADVPEITGDVWFLGEEPPRVYYNMVVYQDNVPSFAGAFINTVSAEATRGLIGRLQDRLMAELPEATVLALPFEQGPPFEAPIELEIYGPDLETLQALGEQARAIISTIPLITYTRAQISGGRPKLELAPDEDEARLAGFELVDLAQQLAAGLEGVLGGTVLEETEELPVRVRAAGPARADLQRIAANTLLPPQRLRAPSATAAQAGPEAAPGRAGDAGVGDGRLDGVPLNAIAAVALVPEITAITRFQRARVNKVQAFVTPFTLPAAVLAEVERRLAAAAFTLPPGYRLDFGGESKESAESQGQLAATVAPLIVLMIATVVLAFNSFRQAGVILAVAGFSVGMALLALWIFDLPMGFMAIIGAMGLIGVSINDSIVVLSSLRADPDARAGDRAAIRRVVRASTRHVLSTTLTTIAGFTPLILFGGSFWLPLATAIAGGIVGATLLALAFVPSVFVLTTRRRRAPATEVVS